jgi:hypothetical protein
VLFIWVCLRNLNGQVVQSSSVTWSQLVKRDRFTEQGDILHSLTLFQTSVEDLD